MEANSIKWYIQLIPFIKSANHCIALGVIKKDNYIYVSKEDSGC